MLNGSSVVNDTDLDDIAEVNATLQVKFTGLKAEAAVLNGVALTAAQIGEAVANNTLTIGAGDDAVTYDNADDADIAGLPLLGRFLNAADMPVLSVAAEYSNATSGEFAATITMGDTSLIGNYTAGDLTAGVYQWAKECRLLHGQILRT